MLHVAIGKSLGAFALNVAFDAPAGVTAVFGRSGSGKTSVVNAVAGLLQPDAGKIAVGDKVLYDRQCRINLRPQHRSVGYVFQDARLFPHMSVHRNLTYGGTHDMARVIDVLGLGDLLHRRPAGLSGGEKQRVALGRALMSAPQILAMDEPLAALDAPRKAEILPYIERLRDEVQIPILYVSHDVSEVARLATTLVILEAGQVVASGPVGTVLSRPDVVPLLGVRDAGAVIGMKVAGRLLDDGLTELTFSGGRILMPGNLGKLGQSVRLRIPAQDVILATEPPKGISALNVLSVTITALEQGRGPGVAVGLRAGTDQLLARVTRRSAGRMGLAVGQQVYAIIKATAVGPEDIGG
ncbi:molybdenum ABC transporter ATP-binding protein [Yoonia sediminilitoris]|uniref:Molybdate transport system ATP-binding protein n=1 Tax=Yoonia sediminilitoris TaxID=1286148 RepID=A0A2T6KJX6_9RHOB|nr:molybdenum ABC transporter ATP-binding protein [Yoonia sediminilitoris]PUB16280.1 molybdate transport system ATP-binding protein [Yoonia sediminilitoris]RCW96629.1 molybdate transport system ATP-binding protein [Yoonia sediminilitoris]